MSDSNVDGRNQNALVQNVDSLQTQADSCVLISGEWKR